MLRVAQENCFMVIISDSSCIHICFYIEIEKKFIIQRNLIV